MIQVAAICANCGGDWLGSACSINHAIIGNEIKQGKTMAMQTTGTFPQLTTPRPKPKGGKKGGKRG